MTASNSINQQQARPVLQLSPSRRPNLILSVTPQRRTSPPPQVSRTRPTIQLTSHDDTYQPHWEENGQGMLFSPKVGTGLSDDPISKQRRKELSDTIANNNPHFSEALMGSTVPLQHLSDVHHFGVRMHHDQSDPQKNGGIYQPYGRKIVMRNMPDTKDKPTVRSIAVHEFGHAYHHSRIPEGFVGAGIRTKVIPGVDSVSPLKEGVATGYEKRYGGLKESYYDQHFMNEKNNQDSIRRLMGHMYFNTQKHVQETGDVPFAPLHLAEGQFMKAHLKDDQPNRDQQLPGMEDL